uniref:Uncharacterized protein n=1 Tax=Haemonchus contortus TaxID=6289 RepID=A0A7I4YK02_HAECO
MLLFTISITKLLLYVFSTFIILANSCHRRKRATAGRAPRAPKAKKKKRETRGVRFRRRRQAPKTGTSSSASKQVKGGIPEMGGLHTAKPLPPRTAKAKKSEENLKNAHVEDEKPTTFTSKTEEQEFLPYPSVKSPTPSAKKRRKEQLLEDKKRKIAEGFYQPRSDQDDTLEKVVSLKMEQSEQTRRSMKRSKNRDDSLTRQPPIEKGSDHERSSQKASRRESELKLKPSQKASGTSHSNT